MNSRYQSFSGPLSRPQRLANMLQRQSDTYTPPQDMQYNPMVAAQARPQYGRVVPRGMVKPLSPGMVTPQGGRDRGGFDNGQE
jgi:hypothetical protein